MRSVKNYLLILTLLLGSVHLKAQNTGADELLSQYHQISEKEIYNWVETLSSPKYKGRLAGTREYIQAAEWVAVKLKEWGLECGGSNNTYFQWFDRPWVEIQDQGEISLILPQKGDRIICKKYTFPDEAMVGMATGGGETTGEVVFAGYGVTAPELGYDDYKNIDVKGKIVMVSRDVPYKDVTNPEYSKWVKYCYHNEKLENAVRHGARGLLYLSGNSANPNISYDPSIIVFGISETVSDDIFAACNRDMKEVFARIDKHIRPESFNTGVNVTLKASSVYHKSAKACNVIGVIPGTNPALKDESVIIGGHLDGVGFIGETIFPGAWDNATGVACMLATAKAMGLSGMKPERTIIFIFTGGEEVGLLGAKEYVRNPLLPLDKVICYINLDMTGNGTGLGIGNGRSYPDLLHWFEEANNNYIHRPFTATKKSPNYGRPRSDSAPFEQAGVKVMALYVTGAYKKGYYHLPQDKSETITPEVMEDLAKLLYLGLPGIVNN